MKIQEKRVVYWLEGEAIQNFGDYLTEYLGRELIYRLYAEGAVFRFIGSAISDEIIRDDLDAANASENGKVVFWTCGARENRRLAADTLAKAEFFGVRGPLTRDVLGLPASTVLGDSAFLLPLFHHRTTSARTAGKTICVPHYFDGTDDATILGATGADLILRPKIDNTLDALKQIIDDIASAEFVLAGSLHAAIVACVYDRPFCYYDGAYVDIPFKWHDFAASIGVSTLFTGNIADGRNLYAQFLEKRISKPLLFPLLAGAPFVARTAMLLAAARHDSNRAMDQEVFSKLVKAVDGVLDRCALEREIAVLDHSTLEREIAVLDHSTLMREIAGLKDEVAWRDQEKSRLEAELETTRLEVTRQRNRCLLSRIKTYFRPPI